MANKYNSVLTYYGGKQRMLPIILPKIPSHRTYVEPFVGGGSVFFNIHPSPVMVINDINGNLANFYRQMKTRFHDVWKLVEHTLHDEHTYKHARDIYYGRTPGTDVEKAWAVWVGSTMSFGGSLFDGSFQITTNSQDAAHPGTTTQNKKKYLINAAKKLQHAMILEKDALQVIKKYNNEKTFIYADPPYVCPDGGKVRQGHYQHLKYNQSDFENLIDLMVESKSKMLLSSYPNEYLQDKGLTVEEYKVHLSVNTRGKYKTEVLTRNYQLKNNLFNQTNITHEL